MTHPEASPDGTGTQTDEVSAALDRLHMLAKIEQLADRESVTADILSEAASVLSAEIERLTRRVEEIAAVSEERFLEIVRARQIIAEAQAFRESVLTAGVVGADWINLVLSEDARVENGRLANSEYLAVKIAENIDISFAALASAAAPDERVLAERELAQAAFKFVAWAMREGPWGPSDLDGGDVQDKAQALGLIVETQYDPDKHGENHEDGEPGDQWFVLAPPILDAIRARTPDH